ncbi:30S ribosomal protein S3, partial [Streptomyces sp. OF1]|nr:30S ribosomal protein S3 [Streptomyces alkaliterrae]
MLQRRLTGACAAVVAAGAFALTGANGTAGALPAPNPAQSATPA